jgi:NAD(P)-dependent dehydrogenase (short-subunit alcohol dehydrogenase family)
MPSFAGKTMFINGGSRGIGKAIALRLAREGANIVITGKTEAPQAPKPRRDACRHRPQLQRQPGDDFEAHRLRGTGSPSSEASTRARQSNVMPITGGRSNRVMATTPALFLTQYPKQHLWM